MLGHIFRRPKISPPANLPARVNPSAEAAISPSPAPSAPVSPVESRDPNSYVVGIDLGTTYSAIAHIDKFGKPIIIKNSDGLNTTPSVVYVETPLFVVGEVALQSTLSDPEHVIQFIKRFMGVANYRVSIAGQEFSPEMVSSLIIRKLVQEAEVSLDGTVKEAVITVPAHFTEAQRQATYEAAQLAGLKVLRIISEPTAAALYLGMNQRSANTRILVYDLGGGTFDVTILEVKGQELNVIAVGGDSHLGGKDFDERIMNFVENELRAMHGDNLHNDALFEAELRLKTEIAKRQLTGRAATPITIKAKKVIEGPNGKSETYIPARVELTREKFEEITADLLSRTEMLVNNVLYKAHLTWDDVGDVLLVGGSSRMPMVREMLTRVTGKRPQMQDPDECVALGAALQAGILAGSEGIEAVEISHVLSHSLGVLTLKGDKMAIDHCIPALTPLPFAYTQDNYTTTEDDQTCVEISIFEGDSTDPDAYANGPIGVFELDSSPPRPKGHPQISVEFRCDENGRVTAFAKDLETGHINRTFVTLHSTRTDAQKEAELRILSEAIIS